MTELDKERLTNALLRLMVPGSSNVDAPPYEGPTGSWEIEEA